MSALWLFLVIIELLCPVIGPEQIAAAGHHSPAAEIKVSNQSKENSADAKFSVSASQEQHSQQVVCNDECLCHAAAIPGIPFAMEKSTFSRSEQTAFFAANPIFNSLPPPFLPPKNS